MADSAPAKIRDASRSKQEARTFQETPELLPGLTGYDTQRCFFRQEQRAWRHPTRTVVLLEQPLFSRDLHSLPCATDFPYAASVGAPTAGATDVKAGKPDSQRGGINGALTLRPQLWPFKC